MKRILFLSLLLVSFNTYSQNNVKTNQTRPYFRGSVKVADTLGVANKLLVDTIKGFSSSNIIIGDTVTFSVNIAVEKLFTDTIGVLGNTKQIYLDSASFIKFVEFLSTIKADTIRANYYEGLGDFTIGKSGTDIIIGADIVAINSSVGIGTSPDSKFHVKATISGTVGSHPAGQIIIQNPADDTTANVVITAYESDGSGNPDQQLWYLGNSSGGNEDVLFLNRRNANLSLGTNDNNFFKMEGDGDIVLFNGTAGKDFTLTFNGETNDGIITYMEDEDRFDVDNDFKVSGDLTVTGDIGIFGTQGFADSSVTIAMTQNVYHKITNSSSDLYTTGINIGDLVFTGDSIQVVTAGHYELSYDLSFSGANTDQYHLGFFVNNVEQSGKGETERDMSIADVGVSAASTILNIGAGQWIALKIKNVQNNNDATVKAGNVTIKKL